MRRLPPLLLATLLALTLSGNALAEGGEPVGNPDTLPVEAVAPTFSVLAGSSITCSTAWPSATLGCWWERPVLAFGDVELALGVDAQVVLSGSWDDAHLAPYFVLAWYGPTVGAWLEARLPDLPGVPLLGTSDWLRAGVTIRIPP